MASKVKNFTELYNDYYPLTFSIVYGRIGDVDKSKDICQEVFIRFYEKYDEVRNPRKWLLGTLRFVVLEHYRKRSNKDVNIDDIFEDMSLSFVNGFRDTRLIIEEALEDKSNFENEKERILFELIAIYNFTYSESGRHLGITERQARYRYGLVINRLVKYFNERGIKSLEDLL